MILISHRGNLSGKILEAENSPTYIENAIFLGYDVEIDLWIIKQEMFLGHDKPQYNIQKQWLHNKINKLWIHCKNINAIEWFHMNSEFNYFWHQEDTITLTSKGFIWAYPGKQPIKNSIAVLPEVNKDDISQCIGICSDYIESFKD